MPDSILDASHLLSKKSSSDYERWALIIPSLTNEELRLTKYNLTKVILSLSNTEFKPRLLSSKNLFCTAVSSNWDRYYYRFTKTL